MAKVLGADITYTGMAWNLSLQQLVILSVDLLLFALTTITSFIVIKININ